MRDHSKGHRLGENQGGAKLQQDPQIGWFLIKKKKKS